MRTPRPQNAQPYDFTVVFKGLADAKRDQNHLGEADFTIVRQVTDQITELGQFVEPLTPSEGPIYTRS